MQSREDTKAWVRDVKTGLARVADWGSQGICQACGEAEATQEQTASGRLSAVKLCDRCASEIL